MSHNKSFLLLNSVSQVFVKPPKLTNRADKYQWQRRRYRGKVDKRPLVMSKSWRGMPGQMEMMTDGMAE
jgi:hypothetical protein